MEDKVMQLILNKDQSEVTWQSMLYELVKSECMNP